MTNECMKKIQFMVKNVHRAGEEHGRKNSGHLNRDISRRSLKQMQIPLLGGELRKNLLTDNSSIGAIIKYVAT